MLGEMVHGVFLPLKIDDSTVCWFVWFQNILKLHESKPNHDWIYCFLWQRALLWLVTVLGFWVIFFVSLIHKTGFIGFFWSEIRIIYYFAEREGWTTSRHVTTDLSQHAGSRRQKPGTRSKQHSTSDVGHQSSG